MSHTIRSKPSSGLWMKQQRHIGYRRLELLALQELGDYASNRVKSALGRIANPWDDKIISYYRGQKWARK